MTETRRKRMTWEMRMAYAFPLPPLATGIVWVALIGLISFGIWESSELSYLGPDSDGRRQLNEFGILLMISSLMWGLLPAAGRATSASEYWDLQDQQPPTDSGERRRLEKEGVADELQSARGLWIGSFCGLIAGFFLVRWIFGRDSTLWEHFAVWWSAGLLVGLIVMLMRGIALTHDSKKRLKPIFEAAKEVDLLDLRPQLLAGRCVLRTAVSWVVGASLSSLFFLLGDHQVTLSILIFISIIGLASVAPPLLQIQRIIRQAKDKEVARLQLEIRDAREEVLSSTRTDGVTTEPGRLADLLAYQHYVDTLPELPFEKGKLAFTTLYFTVPLFSWLWISLLQSWIGLMS